MPMTFLLMFADAKFPCCIARNIDENYYNDEELLQCHWCVKI